MEWTEIAPLVALGVGALGLPGIRYKLGRIESKLDLALRMMWDHTHAGGSPVRAAMPAEGDKRNTMRPELSPTTSKH